MALLGHACSLWPPAVDLACFYQFLRGDGAEACAAAHLQWLVEEHKLPADFFVAAPSQSNHPHRSGSPTTTPDAGSAVAPLPLLPSMQRYSSDAEASLSQLKPAVADYLRVAQKHPDQLVASFDEQIQYFRMLEDGEGYFAEPHVFVALRSLPIAQPMRRALLWRYYELDPRVAAAAFGKRLTRNEIDSLAEALADGEGGFTVKWIKRQLECIRRVHREVVASLNANTRQQAQQQQGGPHKQHQALDGGDDTTTVDTVRSRFHLAPEQVRQYAGLCLAAEHQLRIPPFTQLTLGSCWTLCELVAQCWCRPTLLWPDMAGLRIGFPAVAKVLEGGVPLRNVEQAMGVRGGASGPRMFGKPLLFGQTTSPLPPETAASPQPVGHTQRPGLEGTLARSATEGTLSTTPPTSSPAAPLDATLPLGSTQQSLAATATAQPQETDGARWRYSARLEGEFPTICRTLYRVARSVNPKSSTLNIAALLQQLHMQLYEPHRDQAEELLQLITQMAPVVVRYSANEVQDGPEIRNFFAIVKMILVLHLQDRQEGPLLPADSAGDGAFPAIAIPAVTAGVRRL